MAFTLKQAQAVRRMASLFYAFLPGSGSPSWRGHVSFSTVARDLGLAQFWPGGSKEPAIVTLLEQTLERRPDRFEPLILAIVRKGMTYRQNRGSAIQRDEIKRLNQLLLEVGFKFPDLWDTEFLGSLPSEALDDARETVQGSRQVPVNSKSETVRAALVDLRTDFYALAADQNRQAAGLALEKLLNNLFRLFDLEPRQPFRVTGEQIDGSFVLDYETYLVEAKWSKEPIPESALLVFRGKIEGKSAFTRGAFISLRGFSAPAIDAITRGKQPNFFLVDGYDLTAVLEGQMDLSTLLRFKVRKLTEEGLVFVSCRELTLTSDNGSGEGA